MMYTKLFVIRSPFLLRFAFVRFLDWLESLNFVFVRRVASFGNVFTLDILLVR